MPPSPLATARCSRHVHPKSHFLKVGPPEKSCIRPGLTVPNFQTIMQNREINAFWKECKKHTISKFALSNHVDRVTREADIAGMRRNHYEDIIKTKYLGLIINSSMKTSSDVVRQSRKFYAQVNMLLRNFRYWNLLHP